MIKSSEDANKYYQIVNQYVDDYIEEFVKKHKFSPTRVESYLLENKTKLRKFLSSRGLSQVNGIEQVLSDILEDRVSVKRDSVMTFETFAYVESSEFRNFSLKQCIYRGIEKSTIEHEKLLADYFDVSLGQVEPVSTDKHVFKVGDINVVVYDESEVGIMKDNVREYLMNEALERSMDLGSDVSGLNLTFYIKDVVDKSRLYDMIELILHKDVKIAISCILGCKLCDVQSGLIGTFD